MSDLRAAAERVRQHKLGNSPYRRHALDGFECVDMKLFNSDMATIAKAYLAEHPADSDEPITEEWLESIGWYSGTGLTSWTSQNATFYIQRDRGGCWDVFIEVYRLGYIQTRGQLRRLLTALGIPQKGE